MIFNSGSSAVEVVQEHFLGQRRAFAQAQELQHLVFLGGQVYRRRAYLDGLGTQIDHEIIGLDDRPGIPKTALCSASGAPVV
jgi:hypothetical protein